MPLRKESIHRRVDKLWYSHVKNGILLSREKEQTTIAHNRLCESLRHYVEQKLNMDETRHCMMPFVLRVLK